MRPLRPLALALLPLLAACAGQPGAGQDCRGGPLQVLNSSAQAVEQLYIAPSAADWGRDLLGPAGLAPGARLPLNRPAGPGLALRAVWVNGRAAEFASASACGLGQVTILDGGIRAQ